MDRGEATVSMRQIADSARSSRQAVTQWRARGEDPAHPCPRFPAPLGAERSPRFRLEEVRDWFRRSGAGNNADVVADLPLHSSLMEELVAHPQESSALLVLASVLGVPLGQELADVSQNPEEGMPAAARNLFPAMQEILEIPGTSDLLTLEDLFSACRDAHLVEIVDAVVEAAYGPGPVLHRVHERMRQDTALGTGEATSPDLRKLMAAILNEIAGAFRLLCSDQERFAVAPRSSETVSLLAELCAETSSEETAPGWFPVRFHAVGDAAAEPNRFRDAVLVAWRSLLAHQQGLETVDPDAPASEVRPYLQLGSWLSPGPAEAPRFFEWVQEMLDDLPQEGAVLVLGPAELMLDGLVGQMERRRRDLLIRSAAADGTRVDTPLRWAAALPPRLMGHGGRQPLALWLFAEDPAADWMADDTFFSAYHDLTAPDSSSAVASDAAAAVLGREEMRRHGYAAGQQVTWRRFLAQGVLRLPVAGAAPALGRVGEVMARAEHAVREAQLVLPDGMDVVPAPGAADAGTEARVDFIPWPAAVAPKDSTNRLARIQKGHRIPAELVGEGLAHAMSVVGVPELSAFSTGDSPSQERTIERLDAMAAIPRLRETEPGDVVFTSSPRPMAWMDRAGGNLVEAPARILRLRPAPGKHADPRVRGDATEGRQTVLVPEAVAVDIGRQTSTETAAWKLRVFPRGQVSALESFTRSTDQTRRVLLQRLRALDQVEATVFDGVSAGLLEVTDPGREDPRPSGGPP